MYRLSNMKSVRLYYFMLLFFVSELWCMMGGMVGVCSNICTLYISQAAGLSQILATMLDLIFTISK